MSELERHLQSAQAAFRLERGDLAERCLRRALAIDPTEEWASTALSAALRMQRRYDEAITQAKISVQHRPADAYAHFTLGWALAMVENFDHSLIHGLEAIRISPYSARYYSVPAAIFNGMDQFHDALSIAQNGLMLRSDDGALRRQRAIALAGVGNGTEAKLLIQDILRVEPANPDTFLCGGYVGWILKEHDSAVEHLSRCLKLNPMSAKGRSLMGLVLIEQGRHSVAAAFLAESLRLNPYDGKGRMALRQINPMMADELVAEPVDAMLSEHLTAAI